MNEMNSNTPSRLESIRLTRVVILLMPIVLVAMIAVIAMRTTVVFAGASTSGSTPQNISKVLPANAVSIGTQTPLLSIDSNKPCQLDANNPTPTGGYLLVSITNTTGTTFNGVALQVTGFTDTPGQSYPEDIHLGDGEDGYRYVGTFTSGSVFTSYIWTKFDSPCTIASGNNPDHTFNYTVTVSDDNANGVGVNSKMLTVTMRTDVSANAGGSPNSNSVGPGIYIGEILPVTLTFSNGNVGNGNGAVPSDLLIEPASNGTSLTGVPAFNTYCYRLIDEVVDGASGYTGITNGERNRIYWSGGINSTATSNIITATFFYEVLCAANQQLVSPYSSQLSGNQKDKYQIQGAGTFITGTNQFQIAKTAKTLMLSPTGPELVTWTVTISNTDPKAFGSGINMSAAVLNRVTDTLPTTLSNPYSGPYSVVFSGTVDSQSDVKPATSSYSPTIGQHGVLTWTGKLDNSTYQFAPSPFGSVKLVFTSLLTTTGLYTNTAKALVLRQELGPVTATAGFFAPTAVTLSTFDAHSGGLPWLPIALGAMGMLILGSLAIVLARKP